MMIKTLHLAMEYGSDRSFELNYLETLGPFHQDRLTCDIRSLLPTSMKEEKYLEDCRYRLSNAQVSYHLTIQLCE